MRIFIMLLISILIKLFHMVIIDVGNWLSASRGVCNISHCAHIKQATTRISIFLLSNLFNVLSEFVAAYCKCLWFMQRCHATSHSLLPSLGSPTTFTTCFYIAHTYIHLASLRCVLSGNSSFPASMSSLLALQLLYCSHHYGQQQQLYQP